MVAQRPPSAVPAILGRAEALPLADDAVDAAMAILTIHHWSDQEAGVRELRRVSRGPVVILTIDPAVSARMWLAAEYLPEVVERDGREFPPIDRLVRWLGGRAGVRALPVARTPRTTPSRRSGHTRSGCGPGRPRGDVRWARTDPAVVRAAVERLRGDLASGAWDARHGHLRERDAYNAGLRLVIAAP